MEAKMIASMFEDLKKLINSKFDTVNNNQPSNVPQVNQTDISEINEKMSKICYYVKESSECILQSNLNLIAKTDTFMDDKNEKLNKITNSFDKFNKDINRIQKISDRPQKHIHTIDIDSSKGFITLIIWIFLLMCSVLANCYQFKENQHLTDNDIKYRYIKVNRGIEYEDLRILEDIFEYSSDSKRQKAIRKYVRDYERKIAERADELERAHLKEVKANELLEEAEKIKNK